MYAFAAPHIHQIQHLIARDYRKDRAWWLTGLPIAAVGLMIALIPPSEEWEYKPWQARARQYERNQIIR